MSKKTYLIDNLDCANCAGKIEKKLSQMKGIEEVQVVFSMRQLVVVADDPDKLLPEINEIVNKMEPGVVIRPKVDNIKSSVYVSGHQHKNGCGCRVTSSGLIERIYKIENLCCRICSEKIEQKLLKLPYVKEVCVTFTTQQLKIVAEKDPDLFLDKIQRRCETVKHDVSLLDSDSEPSSRGSKDNKEIASLIIGIITFAAAMVTSYFVPTSFSSALFLISYAILGFDVLTSAVSNLFHGQIFDENFLMSVATIGAFFIGEYPEAVGIMLFFKIGEFFEHRAVEKSRKSIMSAIDIRPDTVNVLVDGRPKAVPAENVSIGDVILVKNGDRVPLDGVIVEGSTQMDTSAITGESVPVSVKTGEKVVSGYINSLSPIKIKVENTLQNSMVSRILESVENAAANKPKIDRFLTRFARVYTPLVVLIAVVVAVIPPLVFSGDFNYWIYTALSFLVISCPCALVLSVPLAFFAGIGCASQKGILFKGGSTLESICNIKAVVMDKTGTITEGNFVVQEIKVENGTCMSEDDLLTIAASLEKSSTHPIARSIYDEAEKRKIKTFSTQSLKEFAGKGIEAVVDGSIFVCGNKKFFDEKNIDADDEKDFGTEVLIAKDSKFIGRIIISDTIKSDAAETVAELKNRNIFAAIVTGDTEKNAQAVASEVGVDSLYFGLLPEQKLSVLKNIREKYGPVMFVGDGINDAPVLAGADVGAAMGSGADSAIEIADIVYMSSKMSNIRTSIDIAKSVQKIAKQNVTLSLLIKTVIMILGVVGLASMWTAVFADTGVAILCILNSVKILRSW